MHGRCGVDSSGAVYTNQKRKRGANIDLQQFLAYASGWYAGVVIKVDTLEAIVAQFAKVGTEGLESPFVFKTPEVIKASGKAGPVKALKELGRPAEVLFETKARLFAA